MHLNLQYFDCCKSYSLFMHLKYFIIRTFIVDTSILQLHSYSNLFFTKYFNYHNLFLYLHFPSLILMVVNLNYSIIYYLMCYLCFIRIISFNCELTNYYTYSIILLHSIANLLIILIVNNLLFFHFQYCRFTLLFSIYSFLKISYW